MGKEGTDCWGQRGPSGTGQGPRVATSVVVAVEEKSKYNTTWALLVLAIFSSGDNYEATKLIAETGKAMTLLEKVR